MNKNDFRVIQTQVNDYTDTYMVAQDVTAANVNMAVYAIFCVVAQAVLDQSDAMVTGDMTAAELAGGSRFLSAVIAQGNAKDVTIEAGEFKCQFKSGDVFKMMAEWEGLCGITAKDAHRFPCTAKNGDMREHCMELKPYKRCRVLNPKRVSVASEERRINANLAVLGQMAQSLTSEGMSTALSLLTAIKSAEKLYGYDMAEMAGRVMRHWHWEKYGTTTSKDAISFTAQDFQHAPERWKQVDDGYAKELLARWREFVANNPAPVWIKKDDLVQFKNQENTVKKWQGALKVYRVYGQLNHYYNNIDWYAMVYTMNGKWTNVIHLVDKFEPWEEPSSKKAKGKAGKKGSGKEAKPTPPASITSTCSPKWTFAEKLQNALKAQIAA